MFHNPHSAVIQPARSGITVLCDAASSWTSCDAIHALGCIWFRVGNTSHSDSASTGREPNFLDSVSDSLSLHEGKGWMDDEREGDSIGALSTALSHSHARSLSSSPRPATVSSFRRITCSRSTCARGPFSGINKLVTPCSSDRTEAGSRGHDEGGLIMTKSKQSRKEERGERREEKGGIVIVQLPILSFPVL